MNIIQQLNQNKNYDTDKLGKGSVGYLSSDYSDSYVFHFLNIKDKIKIFYEIGVHRGGSLEMWADLFPEALIVGMDINTIYTPTRKNIVVEIGDAASEHFISSVIQKHGRPDIVLDDASHMSSHMRKSFSLLWPHTNLIYCIEDLGTQYHTFNNGSFIDDKRSMMTDFFDMVNRNNEYPPVNLDYSQICFSKYQSYIYKR